MAQTPDHSSNGEPMSRIYRESPSAFATIQEANRAIYIDFEGKTDEAPALLGIMLEGQFWQEVLDPRLAMAAEAKQLRLRDGKEVLQELRTRALEENRRIAAFGTSEADKAKQYFGVELESGISYLNVHWLGKRWWLDGLAPGGRPPRGQRFSLEEFEKLLGTEKPKHLGRQKATKKLQSILEQCDKKACYADVSRSGKRSWTNLLTYNRLDVEHTASLAQHIVSNGG
tara:strand:+ start:2686 stop:3369 length:684 start_codon:yes stop_codon:yes gene_type:complete